MITRPILGFVTRTNGERVHIPVRIELRHDPETNPLAVEFTLVGIDAGRDVTWRFARDLLADVIHTRQKAGQGDVRFYPGHEGVVSMCLRNRSGHADLRLPADELLAFLDDTADAAADCAVTLDTAVDTLLAEVLG